MMTVLDSFRAASFRDARNASITPVLETQEMQALRQF